MSFFRLFRHSSIIAAALGGAFLARAQQAGAPDASIHELVRQAVSEKRASLRLPGGVICIDTTIEISGAKDLEIDGAGATIVMTDASQSLLRIKRSAGVTVRNLRFEYDPLPFTQGTITRADLHTVEFELHEGYPDLSDDYARAPVHFFTESGNRHPETFDFSRPDLEILTPRRGRVKYAEGLPAILSPGAQIALDRRLARRISSGVEIRNCTGPVLFEDVALHSSPALCFVGRYNEDSVTFRRVTIAPGPPPAGATRPRLLSSNADGVNFAQCRRGPILENCDFSDMGDDSLNVHGFLMPIVRVDSPTRFIAAYKYTREFTEPMRAGDILRIYNPGDFSGAGAGKLASIVPVDADIKLAAGQIDQLFHSWGKITSLVYYQVDLEAPLDVRAGQWFDLPALNCPGYVIRDSYFHDHRARGLRLMAGDGLVENNRFERLTKSAISIGPELGYWRESGWVEDVRIAGNTLRDIGVDRGLASAGSYVPGAIAIFGRTDGDAVSAPPENRRILIEGNRIENTPVAAIHGYAASDVVVRNNILINTNTERPAGHIDPNNGLATTGPVSLSLVKNARAEHNEIAPGTAPRPVAPPSMTAIRLLNQPYDAGASANADNRRALDLYVPAGPGPFPLVVWIHGGGWHMGDRRIGFAEQFNRAGFAVASLGYRLSSAGHPFPAQIEDCIAGLAWLQTNAAANRIDITRTGLIGHSAGAHLSALILTSGSSGLFAPTKVSAQAAVLWSPPLDLALERGKWPATSAFQNPKDPFQTRFFPTGAYDEAFAMRASPTTYATTKLAPLLIVHHELDKLVPIGQAEEFARIAKATGTDVIFRTDTRELRDPHNILDAALFEEALAFFKQHLTANAPAN